MAAEGMGPSLTVAVLFMGKEALVMSFQERSLWEGPSRSNSDNYRNDQSLDLELGLLMVASAAGCHPKPRRPSSELVWLAANPMEQREGVVRQVGVYLSLTVTAGRSLACNS
jgi:hypothetical protein